MNNAQLKPRAATCLWCDGPIIQPRNGPERKYCCAAHRKYAYDKRNRDDAVKLRKMAAERQGVER